MSRWEYNYIMINKFITFFRRILKALFRKIFGIISYFFLSPLQYFLNNRKYKDSPNFRVVQSLWIGDALSKVEQISINSFLRNGYEFHLYTYSPISNIPQDVVIKDAREILPENEIFKPYGTFSDLFRYKLLLDKGGWWVDLDAVCLKPFDFDRFYVFGKLSHWIICNGVMYVNKKGDRFFYDLFNKTKNILSTKKIVPWATIGPILLTDRIKKHHLNWFVLGPEIFIPIHYSNIENIFCENGNIPKTAYSIHLFNEEITRRKYNKNGPFRTSSIIGQLERHYLPTQDASQ